MTNSTAVSCQFNGVQWFPCTGPSGVSRHPITVHSVFVLSASTSQQSPLN